MLPPQAYDVETFATEPIGTGPFRFVEWVRGQKTVMEANPDYWGEPPKAKMVTYFPLGEEATRTAALRTGDVDIIFTVPVDQAAMLMEEEGVEVIRILSCDTHVLSIGGKANSTFKDHRLRQAVDYAVDREKLINGVLNGYAQMPRSVISPMVFGFNPDLPPHPRDLDKARALMAEAGHADGYEAEIQYTHNSLPKVADCVLSVVADLQEIGMDISVRVHPDWPAAGSFMHPGKFDMFYNSWSTITLDADMPFWRNWHTGPGREIPEEGYDYSEELDALIEEGRYSLDEAERLEAYYKAQELMWEYPTRMGLYHFEDLWGVRDNVQGFEPGASRVLDLTQVSKT
jgi:peptide/nickel transport system substrate-binding protein